jgi:peptide/nickel transport system permease protein
MISPLSQSNRQMPRRFRAFRVLLGNHFAAASLLFLIVVALSAVFADQIATHDPSAQELRSRLQPPSRAHVLGTDSFGRDLFSRIVHGGRYSLTIGLIAVSIALSSGLILGLTAGYVGGRVDAMIMRSADVMLAFPGIMLAVLVMAILGPSLTNLMIAVGINSAPLYIRVIRGSTLSARENQYVEAARAVGCQPIAIMFRHILPNIWAPIIVVSTLGVATTILAGAGLSFLGLGAQPPTPEWGSMLSGGRDYLRQAWWVATFPGLAITFTVFAINVLGDGLRDAFDPQLRGRF